jgi:quercetin dioxygenase-like cupin family protein
MPLLPILMWQAATAAVPLPAPSVPSVQIDVATDKGPQSVQAHTRIFAAGGSSGWHTHPGVEMGIVISGAFEVRLADGTVKRLGPGESFSVPRGTIHNGVNVSDGPTQMAITYVYDKGKPVRTMVDPPTAKRP